MTNTLKVILLKASALLVIFMWLYAFYVLLGNDARTIDKRLSFSEMYFIEKVLFLVGSVMMFVLIYIEFKAAKDKGKSKKANLILCVWPLAIYYTLVKKSDLSA